MAVHKKVKSIHDDDDDEATMIKMRCERHAFWTCCISVLSNQVYCEDHEAN